MYTKRVQIVDYGPIEKLDISFPFENDSPKPVVLVGENGSGKSILLSHIVNGLIATKDATYPDTPEVDVGKVYKLRSISYINSGREYYFARVDYERDVVCGRDANSEATTPNMKLCQALRIATLISPR